MGDSDQLWAIVLAAGEGRRVRSITRDEDGEPAPKQFCRLDGERSMLRWTLERARRLVPAKRTVVVVAASHRRWWEPELADLPAENVVVQPGNRGTGPGILLPFLHVLGRDPRARVLILPSDHHVDDEETLIAGLVEAVREARRDPDRMVLLGARADSDERDYGWIVPAGRSGESAAAPVARFLEKPERKVARALSRRGALINTFIMAADGSALLRLFRESAPWLLGEFLRWRTRGRASAEELEGLYRALPSCDFSREVLEPGAALLSVVGLDRCGWSDLGIPPRLASYLERHGSAGPERDRRPVAAVS